MRLFLKRFIPILTAVFLLLSVFLPFSVSAGVVVDKQEKKWIIQITPKTSSLDYTYNVWSAYKYGATYNYRCKIETLSNGQTQLTALYPGDSFTSDVYSFKWYLFSERDTRYALGSSENTNFNYIDLSGLPTDIDCYFVCDLSSDYFSGQNFDESLLHIHNCLGYNKNYVSSLGEASFGSVWSNTYVLSFDYEIGANGTNVVLTAPLELTKYSQFNPCITFGASVKNFGQPFAICPSIYIRLGEEDIPPIIDPDNPEDQSPLVQEIADALASDPEFQEYIDDQHAQQASKDAEMSEYLSAMQVSDIDFSFGEISIPEPSGGSALINFIMGAPGFGLLITTSCALWIVGILLFGKRS